MLCDGGAGSRRRCWQLQLARRQKHLQRLMVCACAASMPTACAMGPFASDVCWPLCGRITENNPAVGWDALVDGCPVSRCGSAEFDDTPISTAFGPRPLGSGGGRYDFHRGLDLSAPIGTPVFAIADGEVRAAGDRSGYSDPVIIVRHFRPGETGCSSGGGCYTSLYLHMRTVEDGGCCAVSEGDTVVRGQLLGYTGASISGYAHLHFEIRDAPAWDPFSSWQRDCINPLNVLPYAPPVPASEVSVVASRSEDRRQVKVAVDTGPTARYDVNGVAIELYTAAGVRVPQPGDTPVNGYHIHPTTFSFDEINAEYTHKDSSGVPWSSYGEGGVRECPYHAQHGSSYDAHVHLDRPDPEFADDKVGLFNGIRVELAPLTYYSQENKYKIDVTFMDIVGEYDCVRARVLFTGGAQEAVSYTCLSFASPPPSSPPLVPPPLAPPLSPLPYTPPMSPLVAPPPRSPLPVAPPMMPPLGPGITVLYKVSFDIYLLSPP